MKTSTIVEEFVRRQGQHYFCEIKPAFLDDQAFECKISHCTTVAMFWARTLQLIAIGMRDKAESDFEYNDLDAASDLFKDISEHLCLAAEQFDVGIEINNQSRSYVVSVVKEIEAGLAAHGIPVSVIGQYKMMVMNHVVKLLIAYLVDFIDRYRQKLDFAIGETRDEEEINRCFASVMLLKSCFFDFMEMEYQLID